MTDLRESKAVPERWREVYDNYKPKEGVFESVERVQGRYWCHRAVEELGTAEVTVREQAQTIERLTKALEGIGRTLAPGSRTMDDLMRDMDYARDRARGASQKGESK